MLYFLIPAAIFVGVILGTVLSNIYRYKKTASGTLKVDTNDPDGPYLFLELKTTPDVIAEEDYVIFKVNNESYISQKWQVLLWIHN